MSTPRVLITGGSGQLASDLCAQLQGDAEVVALPRTELDVSDDAAVESVFADFRPTIVFNCAAFHNVEVCEREEDQAFEVNARAVKRLASRCAAAEARFVHFSTNYVFDGRASEPYDESDRPTPRSIYAISKLAGEQAALAYAPGALVVRTAGLYGLHGSVSKGGNFVTRMVARAREQGELTVVGDQLLTPTFTSDLAAGILAAVDVGVTGTLHLTNSGATSWHGFTEAIMELAGIDVQVHAATTTIAPGAADRPLNGVMRSTACDRAGLAPLRPWRIALSDYLERAGLLAAARLNRTQRKGKPMNRLETRLDGPILIEPRVLGDERGFFCETYRRDVFADLGIPEEMVQDNHSRSRKGIVRGMHFQIGRGASKLVRCARGAIVDVMVDIRRGSPTFGEWEAFELTEENMRSVYCPIGFAHGFCVLSDVADVMYKQSNYYSDTTERGIAYNDPDVAIEWPLPVDELIPSQRDATAPLLREIESELPFVYRGAGGVLLNG